MDTVARVAVIYLVLLFAFRVSGKREVGKLTPFELVTLMLLPEMVSQALTDGDHSLTNAIVGVTTIFVLVFATSALKHRWPRLEGVLDNPPMLLVANGRMLEANLNAERIAPEEIFSEMHKSGVHRLEDVRWAVLQSDGHIAIIRTEPAGETRRPDDDDEPT